MSVRLQEFSKATRAQNIEDFSQSVFDLAIIGGGITGAGVARDAASRGLKVALIEQNDFASGTSSRSSKLIHGGIRYLENLEFGLVFEALNERHVLFEIAPHLVHPLTFILPVYKGDRVGMFKMGLGMWLYDLLALLHVPKFHEKLNAQEAKARLPLLESKDLMGAFAYSDAYMDDDRLVIETLRSAHGYGAKCANYVQAGKAEFDDRSRAKSLEIKDKISGKVSRLRARHFVSTVGPWTDQFAETLFEWKKILRPTKGIHLTFSKSRVPMSEAAVLSTRKDKRIIFAIPRHEMVIVGTTDTDFKGDPSEVHTIHDDVDYLLKIVHNYFPGADLKEGDILASYSGVRPLVHDGSSSESKTSREHVILPTKHNFTFVAGGKYTTYRRMARDIVETILKNEFTLEERVQFARNQTRDPINPMISFEKFQEALCGVSRIAEDFGLEKNVVQTLVERHGLEALEIFKFMNQRNLKNPWLGEAHFAIQNTMCLNLADFMIRRSPLFLAKEDHGISQLDKVVEIFSNAYGWKKSEIDDQKLNFKKHFEFEMGWRTTS